MTNKLLVSLCVILFAAQVLSAPKKEVKKLEPLPEKMIQTQEVQMVKAAPVEKSASEKLREKRQQMEMQTEEEITQELEKARIEDEKKRRERLFTQGSFAPQEPVAPVAVESAVENKVTTSAQITEPEKSTQMYLGLSGGALNYPDVENINTLSGAAGVALGLSLADRFWLEGGLVYSFQEAEIRSLVGTTVDDVDHIGVNLGLTYQFLATQIIKPYAGVTVAYTNRQYNGGDNGSNAFDAGIKLGADFSVTKRVSLGLDYRYMFNVDYERDSAPSRLEVAQQQAATGTRVSNLESFDYQLILLNTKISF